ncbi:MAG: PIN domain-containing protein [Anaerolineae bacterium]
MATKSRLFLDTSALFAAIWSAEGGARMLLRLGEAGVVQLVVSGQVLQEIERVLRRKAPVQLGALALLLDAARVEVAPPARSDLIELSRALTGYDADALVLAAAWGAEVDFFVTLDKRHFLDNAALRSAVRFRIGTPGDALAWIAQGLT